MKNLKLFTLLIAATIALNSCKKDPTKNAVLPEATQEGKNTVGFILNDEVWVPYGECKTRCNKISANYGLPSAEEFGIDFQFSREIEKTNKSSTLTLYNQIGARITTIGNKIDSIGVNFRGENSIGNIDSYTRLQKGSKFIITKLDTINKVISGEFEFILNEDTGSGKQIILRNGRFDFKMNACICD
jgi:hypothetical protein